MYDIFNLEEEELVLIAQKNTDKNKLIFAILLKHFQLEGRYPKGIEAIDPFLIKDLAEQLNISELVIKDFDWKGRSIERFRKEIRILTGFREATIENGKDLVSWIITEILPKAPKLSECIEYAYEYFRSQKIEPFTSEQMERYVQSANSIFEKNLFTQVYNNLSKHTINLIDQILDYDFNDPEQEEELKNYSEIKFKHLKKEIPGAKLKNVLFEIDKISQLKQLKLPNQLFSSISVKLIKKYYDRILTEPPGYILRYKPITKYGSFALYCYYCYKVSLDNLAELLIQLIHKMNSSAEIYVNKKIVADVKPVDGKFDILYSLASESIANPNGIIKDVIYPKVGEDTLKNLVNEFNYKGKWYQNQVRTKMRSLYSHASRKILLTLLYVFEFKTNLNDSKPLIDAINLIKSYKNQALKYYPANIVVPIKNIIANEWISLVSEVDENNVTKINCFNYEIAILEEVRRQLICKKIWIEGAYKYRDPNDDLPKDFEERREYYYNLLGLPLKAEDFIKSLKEKLHLSLKELNDDLVNNKKAQIIVNKKGTGRIKISPYDPQAEPTNIKKLHREIKKQWPGINLIDILKETDFQVGFTEEMHTVASRENLTAKQLQKRILLGLYAIGSNIGLKRISGANQDLSYSDLRYTKRKYISVANVRAAIVKIINKILAIRDPRIWGEATTSLICDSKKLNAWDQNLTAEWHTRYQGRGVMVYWHVDKKSTCIYSQLKTCSSSEVGSMIKGILDHCTNMEVNQTYVDTHGQNTVGFGMGRFLHFDILPRFKNINKQKLYYPSAGTKKEYANLQSILKAAINWTHIEDFYDEAVKHMVALRLKIVEPDVMIKRFSQDNYEDPVYKVFTEVGKANKTIFLCRYIKSEELRIEIHEALNIVERVNSIMSFIFYGKLGEISTNMKTDQELAILCLHLLQVCMVYINTIIIQEKLLTPEWENILTVEDKRALNTLFHANINPYGLFPLNLDERLGIKIFENKNKAHLTPDPILEEVD